MLKVAKTKNLRSYKFSVAENIGFGHVLLPPPPEIRNFRPSYVLGQERAELRKWVTKNEEIRMHL